MIQFGQGLQSAQFRGEELNSVLEQAPRLGKGIADGLGVGIGKLRELGTEGQLTPKRVLSAIASQHDVIAREYARIGATVGQSMVVLNNSIGHLIAGANESSGATGLLADAIIGVSGEIDKWAAANRQLIDTKLPDYIQQVKEGIVDVWGLISGNKDILEFGLLGLIIGGRKGAMLAAGLGIHIHNMKAYYQGLSADLQNIYGVMSGKLDWKTGERLQEIPTACAPSSASMWRSTPGPRP